MNSAISSLRYGISTAALRIAAASPAHAQVVHAAVPSAASEAPIAPDSKDAASAAAKPEATQPATIVVTGTLFRDSNASSISPVTLLNSATLLRANITTAQNAIRSVSADSAGSISTGFRNGFSAGGAAVSLRRLGVSSTIVLIDGLRSANFPLNDDGHNAYVDLTPFPSASSTGSRC